METKVNTNVIQKKENGLIDLIKKDTKLDKQTRMSYEAIASLFLEKFDENLDKTSIEMNKSIPLGIDTWKDFLNYPVVRKYIQSFKDEKIVKIADKGLMEGNKDAVNIKKVMEDKGPVLNNSNIVLIRLPEKMDFD